MNHKTILSLGFLLLCASVLVDSLQNANAYPHGPNVSMGSNPIDNYSASCSSWDTLYTNNTTQTFIITDVVLTYPGSNVAILRVNGQRIYESRDNYGFNSGLKIEPGETIDCVNSGNIITISGYYTH